MSSPRLYRGLERAGTELGLSLPRLSFLARRPSPERPGSHRSDPSSPRSPQIRSTMILITPASQFAKNACVGQAFPQGILLEYGPERYFEAGAGTKAI